MLAFNFVVDDCSLVELAVNADATRGDWITNSTNSKCCAMFMVEITLRRTMLIDAVVVADPHKVLL